VILSFVLLGPCHMQLQTQCCSPVRERLWESKGTRTAVEQYLLRSAKVLFLSLSLSLSLFLNIHVCTFSSCPPFFSSSHSPKKRESLPRDARLNGGLRHARIRAGGVRAQNNIGMRPRIEKRASNFPLSPTIPFASACITVIDSVYIHPVCVPYNGID